LVNATGGTSFYCILQRYWQQRINLVTVFCSVH
jgi:hypothetical protein